MQRNWSNIHKWIVRYGDDSEANMSELDELLLNEPGTKLTSTKNSVLHFSAICNASTCLEKFIHMYPHLINERNDKGETPLHWACTNGSLDNVKILLRAGANYHKVDFDNNSILHFAVQNGNYKTVKLILKKNLCDINLENIFGNSPLHVACIEEEYRIMKLLIAYRASTSKIDSTFADDGKIMKRVCKYLSLQEQLCC